MTYRNHSPATGAHDGYLGRNARPGGFGLVVPELGAGIDLALVPLWQKGFIEVERRVAHRLAFLARFQRRRQVA